MSTRFPRGKLLAGAGLLLALPSVQAADHREAPLINIHASGGSAQCADTLQLPIRVSVQVPPALLRAATIPVSFITRGVDGDVDATDYDVWKSNYGAVFSAVLNPSSMQSSEVFMSFPAVGGQDYDVVFGFQSVVEGGSCVLSGKVVGNLAPVQVISIHIPI